MFSPVPNFPALNAYASFMGAYQQWLSAMIYGNPFLRF